MRILYHAMNLSLLLTQALPPAPGVPGAPGLAAVEPAMEVLVPGPACATEVQTVPGATFKANNATPTPALVSKFTIKHTTRVLFPW